ncbi:MAG: RNA methyltransferase [Bacteroidota bacterium]
MGNIKHISSTQNPLIKNILLLQEKSRERRKSGLFVLEGQRELQLAIAGNYQIETLCFVSNLLRSSQTEMVESFPNANLVEVTQEVYTKIAYRNSTEGVLAIARSKPHDLEQLQWQSENPLILVAEAPEKPGNIGALLRTADAANLDAVIIANPKGDLYNPNIIRSSLGCVFTQSIATGDTEEVIAFLKSKNVKIRCAALTASKPYLEADFSPASAIVVGTEATGLSDNWLQHSDSNIIIPMEGQIDSMNVSVSAAILIFEAKRQRG